MAVGDKRSAVARRLLLLFELAFDADRRLRDVGGGGMFVHLHAPSVAQEEKEGEGSEMLTGVYSKWIENLIRS